MLMYPVTPYSPFQAGLRRVVRYVVIPAVLVVIDTLVGYLQAGQVNIDFRTVGIVGLTALLAGLSKFARDELNVDAKII